MATVSLSPSVLRAPRLTKSPSLRTSLENRCTRNTIHRLIGDKAYDSDELDHRMAEKGAELIALNRTNRKRRTQDGRPLRQYRRRWNIERLWAWLHNFRFVVRYERHDHNFLGFVQLGCPLILLRSL